MDLFRLAKKRGAIYHGLETNETTAFKLTSRISHKGKTFREVSELYDIGSFKNCLTRYYKAHLDEIEGRSFREFDCWGHVRVQIKATRDPDLLVPLQTVQALPPSAELKYGRCNFVLIKNRKGKEYNGVSGMLYNL